MQIIELAGCSGVGKSTLLESFLLGYTGSEKFIATDERARHLITKQILKERNSKWQYLFFPEVKIPLFNNLLCRKILEKEYKKELFKQYRNWEECLKIMFVRHSDPKKNLRLLYRYSALLSRMESQSFYQRFPLDYFMVLDSGLFHKVAGILLLLDQQQIDEAINLIYSKIPVIPYGLIHLKASPSIIHERIFGRESLKCEYLKEFKEIKRDKVYKRTMLEEKINQIGVKIYEKRGVKVYEIDASENISIQLQKVTGFLDGLNNREGKICRSIGTRNAAGADIPEYMRCSAND